MFAHFRSLLCIASVLFSYAATAAVAAQTFTVTVGGNTNTFSPNSLTIHVGDTVTWKNVGGFHNVAATDGSFRNGDASQSAWTFSHTFNSAGTVNYVCEIHQAMGMTGSITVNDVAPPPSIKLGGYLSGNWFNPAQGGHGFQLEFTNQFDSTVTSQHELVAIWFVYTPDGSDQNWIYAQGPFDATKSTVTLPATIFHGPKFPFPLNNYDPNVLQGNLGDWGSVTLSFSDCNNGTASWTSGVTGYGTGSMPIQRLTSIQGTACPQ